MGVDRAGEVVDRAVPRSHRHDDLVNQRDRLPPEDVAAEHLALREVHGYRDLATCDLATYARLHVELLNYGVMIDEDNMEYFITCEDHSDEDLERTVEAFHTALADVNAGRVHMPEAAAGA